jgi:L-ribulose-5-phosphate 3-epimerase
MPPLDRRSFLHATGAALTLSAAQSWVSAAADAAPTPAEKPYRKAVKWGMIQHPGGVLEKFKLLKSLGFDGVELDAPSDLNPQEVLAARDATDLPIHGVVDSVHWRDTLSHPDPAVRARGVEALRTAIRDAKTYGATTVLLVPALVNKDVTYAEAYERSQAEIRKVLPFAEEAGITIALENVWNNFLLSPLETARYIDELESPRIAAYFDVGNVLRYGWPVHWIKVLGARIAKLDIKEYSLQRMHDEGLGKGFEVELLEGDCDWPSVMAALREIGYTGWGTAEIPGGGEERLREIAGRMDRIFAS